jgi:hypothetical protein
MDEALLLAAARRSYELGRLRRAGRRSAVAAAVAALPLHHCAQAGRAGEALVGIAALATLVALFAWRGQGYGRGVGPGLVAGVGPLLLPMLASWTGLLCSTTICGVLPAASVLGGLAGGLALAGSAFGAERRGASYWFAAAAIAASLGVVGCLHVGLAGLGGMAAGLFVGTVAPLAVRAMAAR